MARLVCLARNRAENWMWEESPPGPENGYFYLVRGSGGSCAVGTWDSISDAQVASRDAGVESAPGARP